MSENRKGQSLVVTTRDTHVRTDRVVRTMLDMVDALERRSDAIATVILGGDFARDREVETFLRETYPSLEVVALVPS
ncbi:MAG TPA: hypothetical protein VL326_25810 [Kofleriaceae bacterium]|jgi:hypothetical protein|nr:hypothetical protein [Kofleriaceae bacterium]